MTYYQTLFNDDKGNTLNESFLWDSNTFYQFINSYVTELNDFIIPNKNSLFTNINHINNINSKQKSISIENEYYRLFKTIVILNQMENKQFELS